MTEPRSTGSIFLDRSKVEEPHVEDTRSVFGVVTVGTVTSGVCCLIHDLIIQGTNPKVNGLGEINPLVPQRLRDSLERRGPKSVSSTDLFVNGRGGGVCWERASLTHISGTQFLPIEKLL